MFISKIKLFMLNCKIKRYLKSICKNCLKHNHRCIKDDDYLGLCAKNDMNELIEDFLKSLENN